MSLSRSSLWLAALLIVAVVSVRADSYDEFDDDDDEFVGATPIKATPSEPNVEAKKVKDESEPEGEKLRPPPKPLSRDPRDWLMEIAFASFLVLFIINFFSGKKTNQVLATAWGTHFNELFNDNFSLVGASEGESMLMKESLSTYKMWASGRHNVESLMCTLDLKKRQDLFYTLLGKFSDSPDTLQMDFALPEGCIDTFVWALLPRKDEKPHREAFRDVGEMTSAGVPSKRIPEQFVICTDCPGISTRILDEIASVIKEYEQYIQSIHISDSFTFNNTPRVVRCVYKLPDAVKMEDLRVVMKMTMFLVDWVTRQRLTSAEKAQSKKAREAIEAKRMKETIANQKEKLALKKQQELEKEKERYDKMTPDQQRKYDEKKRQEEYKKRLKSGSKVKMMKM